jgi:hypothetical protein
VVCCLAAVALAGCGGDGRPGVERQKSGSRSAENVAEPKRHAATGERTAADSLQAVVSAFDEAEPVVLWETLPATYQQDVNGLIRDFGGRMDPELWNRVQTVAGKLARLLRDRRELFLAYPPLKDDPLIAAGPLQQVSTNWHVAVGLLEALEAADLVRLQSFDGRRAFSTYGRDDLERLKQLAILLPDENPFSLLHELLSGAEVRQLAETGDRARVQVVPRSGEPREFEFVRTEGRWFPAAWQAAWGPEIAAARDKLERELAPEVIAQKKQELLPVLAAWEASIDRLAGETRPQAFYELLDRELLPVRSGGGTEPQVNREPSEAPPAASSPPGGTVTIEFSTRLDEHTADAVAQALLALCDSPDGIVLPVAGGPGTRLAVSPVSDVRRFSGRITFGRVTAVDPEQRRVGVELPAGRK